MAKVVVMDHPLIQHKIGYIRRTDTGTKDFRETIAEIANLICYEATRDLKLKDVEIETPICKTTVKELAGKKLAVVPILRAGLGMGDGVLQLVPAARLLKLPLLPNRTHPAHRPTPSTRILWQVFLTPASPTPSAMPTSPASRLRVRSSSTPQPGRVPSCRRTRARET